MISKMFKKIVVPVIALFFLSVFLFGEIREAKAAICGTNPGTCASGYSRESYVWNGSYWTWKCCKWVWESQWYYGCCYPFPCNSDPSSIFYCDHCKWSITCTKWVKVKKCTSCAAYPPKCGTAAGKYFDDQPSGTKCSVGSGSAISYNASNWTFNWTCSAISRVCSCQAYKNAQCGSAQTEGPYFEAPSENLCEVGDPSDVIANGDLWEWECQTDRDPATVYCSAEKETLQPGCTLNINPAGICLGDSSTVVLESLFPSKDKLTRVDWESPDSEEEGSWVSPDAYNNIDWDESNFSFQVGNFSNFGAHPITVWTDGGIGDYGSTNTAQIYVKPASCTLKLSPSVNLTVGMNLDILLNYECMEPNTYNLNIFYQGENDPESYEYVDDNFADDNKITIKIKKAGSYSFTANVADPDSNVSCDCQTTTFTEGSEWWERKPE
jgi:hypothetical protein